MCSATYLSKKWVERSKVAVGPLIEKQTTRMRRSISAGERLAVTLYFSIKILMWSSDKLVRGPVFGSGFSLGADVFFLGAAMFLGFFFSFPRRRRCVCFGGRSVHSIFSMGNTTLVVCYRFCTSGENKKTATCLYRLRSPFCRSLFTGWEPTEKLSTAG